MLWARGFLFRLFLHGSNLPFGGTSVEAVEDGGENTGRFDRGTDTRSWAVSWSIVLPSCWVHSGARLLRLGGAVGYGFVKQLFQLALGVLRGFLLLLAQAALFLAQLRLLVSQLALELAELLLLLA